MDEQVAIVNTFQLTALLFLGDSHRWNSTPRISFDWHFSQQVLHDYMVLLFVSECL
jgi:hypothetical protein